MNKPRWVNCCYSDVVKLCIHPSIEDTVTVCDPKNCDFYFSHEQAEEYVKPSIESQQLGTAESKELRMDSK